MACATAAAALQAQHWNRSDRFLRLATRGSHAQVTDAKPPRVRVGIDDKELRLYLPNRSVKTQVSAVDLPLLKIRNCVGSRT